MRNCALTLGALLILAGPAAGDIYLVNPDGSGDYPMIQVAINLVQHGDIIELGDGVFCGDMNRDLDFHGKAITVRSRSGNPEDCIIDCEGGAGAQHRAFDFNSGEGSGSIVEGITITNGYMAGC
jgi:hypothetical protein